MYRELVQSRVKCGQLMPLDDAAGLDTREEMAGELIAQGVP